VLRSLTLIALFASCGGGGTGTLALSWRFADGRRCTDSGVSTVEVLSGTSSLLKPSCSDGFEPAAVMVNEAPRGGTLTLRALSPQSGELYRAEQVTDPTLLPTTFTLYPTRSR
jgi:hypothetical protein